jgi:hypothetical protein
MPMPPPIVFTIETQRSFVEELLLKLALRYHGGRLWKLLHWPSKISAMYSSPIYLWSGNLKHGSVILSGFFSVEDVLGRRYQKSWAVPQDLFADDEYFTSYLCQFGWLRDLKATGDMSARRLARRLIEHWYDQSLHTKTKKKLRRNEDVVLAERLSNFILLYDFFGASADDSFKRIFFKNVQIEYRALKKKYAQVPKIGALKSLIEFNIYCEYDRGFFRLLLAELESQLLCAKAQIQSNFVVIYDVFRDFCTAIEIRNALIQWEKSFVDRQTQTFIRHHSAFDKIQEYLHDMVQFIRFFRHSNGKLCRISSTKLGCFFEQVLSSDVDIALSQVESSATPSENELNGILRLINKQSVLFVNLRKFDQTPPAPNHIDKRLNSMNCEWSYQSFDVICGSSVGIIHQPNYHDTPDYVERAVGLIDEYSSKILQDSPLFSGVVTDHGESYAFNRELSLQKDSLQGVDTLIVDDSTRNAFVVLSFFISADWIVAEINHEEQSLFGEVVMHQATSGNKSVKKRKWSCLFKIEGEQLFSISLKNTEGRRALTIVTPLSSGIPDCIRWSFSIVKA